METNYKRITQFIDMGEKLMAKPERSPTGRIMTDEEYNRILARVLGYNNYNCGREVSKK